MKNKLQHLLLIGYLLSAPVSFSQLWVEMMLDPNANFYETQEVFNEFWEGKTIEKGKGYKQFKRWEHHMEPRVYPSGDVKLASQTMTNYRQWEEDQMAAGIPKSLNGAWTAMGPVGNPANGGAGRINFIRFDPTNSTTFWVGAPDGGLWKTTNGGTSYTTNTDQLTVIGCSDVAIDPTNNQIMYLATGDSDGGDTYSVGVLKSTNGGTTWNTTGLTWTVNQGRTISRILVNPTNPQIVMAFASNGIWRSTNGGTTWAQPTGTFNGIKDAEFKPGDPNTVYAAGTSFRRSTDGGATWTAVTLPLNSIGRIAIAVSPANPAYVYLLAANNSNSGYRGVMRSTNSGGAFTTQSTSPNVLGWDNGADTGGQGWYDLAIAVSPTNAEEVFVGGVNIWRSTNGGTNWTLNSHWYGGFSKPYVHADIHDLIFLPGSGTTLYVGHDGGVSRTTNSGTAYSDITANLTIAQQYKLSQSTTTSNLILAGHQDNGTNRLSGTTWSERMGGDGMDCYIDRTNNNFMIASLYYGDYYRSTNGGNSFSNIADPAVEGQWVSVIHQDPVTAATVYAGGRPALYRTTNIAAGTVVWTALATPPGTGSIINLGIAPSNNQIIYSLKSGTGGVSKSINAGTSFTSTAALTTAAVPTCVAISNTNPDVAFVTFSGYSAANKVFRTTNGGTSWTNISAGLPNVPVNCVVYVNNSTQDAVYIGTDIGVFYRDNTTGWIEFSSGLPRTEVSDLEIFYPTGRLRAATFGRGTWDSDLYSATPAAPTASFTANPTTVCQGQTVQYTNTSTGFPDTYSWSFPGGTPATSTAENPVVTYNTAGTYNASLTVSNAFGNNSVTQTDFITVVSGLGDALPLTEGFTAATFPPAGWSLINEDGGATTWVRSATIGVAPTAGNSMMFDNYNFDDSGNQDEVRTQRLNFTGVSASQLTFHVAYAPYDATYNDGLEVLVSSDCGSTFTSVFMKTNTVLATAPSTTAAFTPTAAQWRLETVDLSLYDGMSNIIVAFRNLAGYGNRLFVDNINLNGTVAAPLPEASFTASTTTLCSGNAVTFTNTSTNGTSYSWTFAGGTPATSTATNPIVTYATPGTYNVTLTATNATGSDTETITGMITVTGAPAAPGAITGLNTACSNQTGVAYSIAAVGGATSYTWTVPAGATITSGQGTTAVAVNFGTTAGSVTVTATNSCGTSAAATLSVSLTPAPTAPTTITGLNSVCSGQSAVSYSIASVGGASSYTWTVPAGATISGGQGTTSIIVNYGANGGNVSVTANNSCGSSSPTTLSVTMNTTPSAPGVIAGSNAVCPGSTGNSYSVTPVNGATSYTWTVPGGASIVSGQGTSGIVVNFGSNAGNVTVTASNSCGTSAATALAVSLSGAAPATPGTIAGPTSVCIGDVVIYSIAAVNGATNYSWSVPLGSSVNSGQGSTSIAMLVGSSNGNITVNASSSCGTSGNSVSAITVNTTPSAPAVSVQNNCGESVLTASGSNLLWSTGSSASSVTTSNAGIYTVTQTITGCTSPPASIEANPISIPNAPELSVINGCGLSTIVASGSNIQWSTGETTSTIVVTTSGSFLASQSVGGCVSPMASISSAPLEIPSLTFSTLADVCINDNPFALSTASPNGGTYSGPGVVSNNFDPELAGYGTHVIVYDYTASNGCSNSIHQTITVGCASVLDDQLELLSIYPNPSFGTISVSGIDLELYQHLDVLDQMGRIVLQQEVDASTMELDLQQLASGQYLIRLVGTSEVLMKKVQLIQK